MPLAVADAVTAVPVKFRDVVRSRVEPNTDCIRPSETTCPGSVPTNSVGIWAPPASGRNAMRPRYWSPEMRSVSEPIHRPLSVAWKP